MWLEAFEQQIRRDFKTDVGNVEQRQGGVDLIAFEVDLLWEPECQRIADVDAASNPSLSVMPDLGIRREV